MNKQPSDEPILGQEQTQAEQTQVEQEQVEQEQVEQEQVDFLPSQSEIDKKSKIENTKKSLVLIVFLLLGILVFGVLLYSDDKPSDVIPLNDDSQSSNYDGYKLNIDTNALYTQDYSNQNEVKQLNPEIVEPEQSSQLPENVENDGINALIVSKLDALLIKQEALTDQVESLAQSHIQLEKVFEESEAEILARINHVAKVSQALGMDGQRRDNAISDLLTVVKGFDSSIKEQRYSFPLEILHTEIWSGKQRVVAIKPREPRHLIKIYVGQEYESWLLKEVTASKAIFEQVEIGEIMEVSL
ncbi:MAG: hypothetical protein CMK64_05230 [Pseudoalteromonas sp.]|nr:hypothetical protein [Pseudoalteromonas sp.]|tara:strand:- start:51961 stop:52860 length:900 start_codon:yes stop_codon:yes gene_type:complete